MYKGKHAKKSLSKKPGLLLASLLLILLVAAGSTIAYLADETGTVTNTFTLGTVPNEVIEDVDGTAKNNVAVKNNGEVDAFVRAAVVITWAEVDASGNPTGNIYHALPAENTDYEITWTPDMDQETDGIQNKWFENEGFYYYSECVEAGTATEDYLLTGCKLKEGAVPPVADAGCTYQLSVEIMAQTIQADGKMADGTSAVMDAWGVDLAQ